MLLDLGLQARSQPLDEAVAGGQAQGDVYADLTGERLRCEYRALRVGASRLSNVERKRKSGRGGIRTRVEL